MTEPFVPRDVTSCKACGARIFFAETKTTERMPVNVEPDDRGNLAVYAGTGNKVHANVIRPGQAAGMRAAGLPTFVSHFSSCPRADEFRRKARRDNADRANHLRRQSANRAKARR
ncbi:hypothetical protein GCM10007304_18160 [Rhodococcoides trifolii]|uniref:Uncharacterized protein n=1 Tax=Rhodococcoides trifolii TaxID=908250 RepID=A0A917D051_9NOCA|nr:hypothetical protein [Rhodococcus trifolii]GGG04426.1 hypothetical protein GCM10007304_18160 [Rhodococcus trifolii]